MIHKLFNGNCHVLIYVYLKQRKKVAKNFSNGVLQPTTHHIANKGGARLHIFAWCCKFRQRRMRVAGDVTIANRLNLPCQDGEKHNIT
jgi:hypothetical protein